ncbi:MAG: hypothetical protein WCD86_05015 [Ktedonobacteraceae bacterium]
MQQTQQREVSERMSWARALIFGVGFFFVTAILLGQLPSYIYFQVTTGLTAIEQGLLALTAAGIGSFLVIQAIVMLFDPKPVVPPAIFSFLGVIFAIGGLALAVWAGMGTNQYFPTSSTNIAPLLGGNFLWLEPGAIDWVMVGLALLFVGVAWVFYSVLARREQTNPDRSDRGTTPAIRGMIITSVMILIVFLVLYTLVNDQGLAYVINPAAPTQTLLIIDIILDCVLGLALFLALGAFALRLHYLMRPVRKRTMAPLYAFGALGLAQVGAICFVVWLALYPLIAWMHNWSFIGLGNYLIECAKISSIPQSCFFTQQGGYIIDTLITGGTFTLLLAAAYFWNKKRNLVVIGSVVFTAAIGLATLLIHTNLTEIYVTFLLSGGMLVLAAIWTSVARREFAVVGENNLGCLGMWLVVGTCLLVYMASFAFFSMATFNNETEPNIPFVSGTLVQQHVRAGGTPILGYSDAVMAMIVLGIVAAMQFYFLMRNRYKV